MKQQNTKDKIREICTYHGEEGTSGYLLDEDRFAKIFALIDEDKLNYKERGYWDYFEEKVKEDIIKKIEEMKKEMIRNQRIENVNNNGYNQALEDIIKKIDSMWFKGGLTPQEVQSAIIKELKV